MGQRRTNRHKSWQVLVLSAQTVRHPGSHTGTYEVVAPSVQLQQRAAVGCIGTVYTVQHAEIVDLLRQMRKQLTDPTTTLTILAKFPGRTQQVVRRCKLHSRLGKRQGLAIIPLQARLVLKRIYMRWAAFHEQKNDTACARRKVGLSGSQKT